MPRPHTLPQRRGLAVAVQLALTLAAGLYAPRIRAQQIACPASGITVSGGASNSVDPCNVNNLTVTSTGFLSNEAGGKLNNNSSLQLLVQGSLINRSGGAIFDNNSTLNIDDGSVTNEGGGFFNNSGSLTVLSGFSQLVNNGTFNNSGTLHLDSTGLVPSATSGGLNNHGTLNNSGYLAIGSFNGTVFTYGKLVSHVAINNNGDLVNYAGTLYNRATATLANNASLLNAFRGIFNNAGGLTNNYGATFINSGKMYNRNYDPTHFFPGSGTITNSGMFTNNASGELTNFGTLNNEATGSFSNSGTLNNAAASSYAPAATLNNSGYLLNTTGPYQSTTGALLSNSGILNNNAGATLLNQGQLNNNAGATLNNSGSLHNSSTGPYQSTAGARFTNSGTLNNNAGADFKNYGTFTNAAGGTLNNAGVIDNDGPVFTNAGTLTNDHYFANRSGRTIDNSGALTVANSGTLRNDGAIANSGTLTVAGTGGLYGAGAITQSAGMLQVDGDLAQAAVTISGGVLTGTGTITAPVTMNSGGVLEPGAAGTPGTLTITGSLMHNAGSTLRVNVTPSQASRVVVNGTANLAGTVQVVPGAGTSPSTPYTILTATGGVTGTFSGVTTDSAFLTPSLGYQPNSVSLTFAQTATFDSVALTSNQSAVSTLLGTIRVGGNGNADLQAALSAILTMPAGPARAAYDNLAGASQPAASFNAQFGMVDGFVRALTGRLGGAGSGNVTGALPVQLASAGATLPSLPTQSRNGAWVLAYGNDGKTSGDENGLGYRQDGAGIAFGADTDLDRNWRIGGALNIGTQRAELDRGGGRVKTDGVSIAAYARYTSGALTIDGMAGVGRNGNDSTRSVNVGGMAGTASADYDGDQRFAHLEVALKKYWLEPIAAFSYVRVESPSYTESGAGGLSLAVDSQARESIKSYLGARTVHELGASLKLTARALWTHEHGDADDSISTARFTGAPAAGAFQTTGPQLKRDGVLLGLGVSGDWKRNVALFGDLAVEARQGQWNASVFAGGRYSW